MLDPTPDLPDDMPISDFEFPGKNSQRAGGRGAMHSARSKAAESVRARNCKSLPISSLKHVLPLA